MRHCETPDVAVIQHGVQKTGILIKHNEMTIEVTNALRERERGNGNENFILREWGRETGTIKVVPAGL